MIRGGLPLLFALLLGLGGGWYLADRNANSAAPNEVQQADFEDHGGGIDDDDGDEAAVRQRLLSADGEIRIRLSPAAVELGGIRTAVPDAVESTVMMRRGGRVLAAGPLLAGQADLRALNSEVNAQGRVIAALDKRLAELTTGSRLGAQRDISALQLERTRAQARAVVLNGKRDAARLALEVVWGRALIAETVAAEGTAQALLDGDAALIGFTLPAGAAPPAQTFTVTLAGQSLVARNMGPSPTALAGLPGRGWYGLVDGLDAGTADAVPAAGMPVVVWTGDGSSVRGVLIPPSAIVWDGDGRWLFVMPKPNEYVRRAVGQVIEQPNGLLVTGIPMATAVVVAGAQTLQGERFRSGIPEEDED